MLVASTGSSIGEAASEHPGDTLSLSRAFASIVSSRQQCDSTVRAAAQSLGYSAGASASSPRALLHALVLAGPVAAAHVVPACRAAEASELQSNAEDGPGDTGELTEPLPHPLGLTPSRAAALVPRLVFLAVGLGTIRPNEVLRALAGASQLCQAGARECAEAAASAKASAHHHLERLRQDEEALKEGRNPESMRDGGGGDYGQGQGDGAVSEVFDRPAA